MFTIGKKSKIGSAFGKSLRMLLILGTIVPCIEACSKDDENQENEPPRKETPNLEDALERSEQDTIIRSQDPLSNI